MKTKLATGALVGAILIGQYEAKAQTQTNNPTPPKCIVEILETCVDVGTFFVALGATCYYVNVICSEIWGALGKCFEGPPVPPPDDSDSDSEDAALSGLHLVANSVSAVDLSNFGYLDVDPTGAVRGVFTNCTTFQIQSGTNLTSWSDRFNVRVWKGTAGSILVAEGSDGIPLKTNYTAIQFDSHHQPFYQNKLPHWCQSTNSHEYFRLLSQ